LYNKTQHQPFDLILDVQVLIGSYKSSEATFISCPRIIIPKPKNLVYINYFLKVDRRHGKRPLPLEASEEKEKEHDDFPSYASTWSETDMSAMVSALTQVMGTTDNNPTSVQSTPYGLDQSVVKDEPDQSQPVQDQGNGCIHMCCVLVIFALLYVLPTLI
jgi:hypothetical protein